MVKRQKKLKKPFLDENLRQKMCTQKTRYVSAELAAKAVEMYGGSRKFSSYKCAYCNLFHNTTREHL
jgi:hypothetical protein